MLISIPPKYSVAEVICYIKGKSAMAVARQFGNKKKNFNGEQLWARGYAVSTVGFEEQTIKDYIRHQERLDGLDSGEISEFYVKNYWQSLRLLTSDKLPALPGRYDSWIFLPFVK
jgi:putative transposase